MDQRKGSNNDGYLPQAQPKKKPPVWIWIAAAACIAAVVMLVLVFTLGSATQTTDPPEVSRPAAAASKAPVATATPEFNPAEYSVAICMPVFSHPVHRIVQLGFLKAARELGYTDARVIGTEGSNMDEVHAAAEAFAADGGDGILLWASDSYSFETIESLHEQGVYVGIPHFNLQLDDGTYPEGLAFGMGCSPKQYGAQVAGLLADKLNGRTGSVVSTFTATSFSRTGEAAMGFITEWDKLAADGAHNLAGITLLEPQYEGFDIATSTALHLELIQAHPDLIGVFGIGGNSAIAWAEAAAQAGKANGEIAIVGMDAYADNLQALRDGKVLALVAQPLYQEAHKTMEYFDILFRGGEVPKWTDLVAPLVTLDGEGENGPAYHEAILAEVEIFFN